MNGRRHTVQLALCTPLRRFNGSSFRYISIKTENYFIFQVHRCALLHTRRHFHRHNIVQPDMHKGLTARRIMEIVSGTKCMLMLIIIYFIASGSGFMVDGKHKGMKLATITKCGKCVAMVEWKRSWENKHPTDLLKMFGVGKCEIKCLSNR